MNSIISTDRASDDQQAIISTLAMAKQARDSAFLLGLLATLFREKASQATLQVLREEGMSDALRQAGMELDERFFSLDVMELADSLAVEFTSLFLLPGSLISPHESVQLKGGSGLLRGPETAQVKEYYEMTGFEIHESVCMEPDHLSIELEYLRHLNEEAYAAWSSGDTNHALDALRYQKEFLEKHLCRWFPEFKRRIEEANISDFYQQVVQLTAAFLADQEAILPDLIEQFPVSFNH